MQLLSVPYSLSLVLVVVFMFLELKALDTQRA